MSTTYKSQYSSGLLSELLVAGRVAPLVEAVRQALNGSVAAATILDEALLPGMMEVGRRFEHQECFIPEVLMAAKAMTRSLDVLRPHLAQRADKSLGSVVLATVEGDLHDIGKNLVKIMLEGNGFRVIDLGVDVSYQQVLDAVRLHQPDLVGLSCLITTCLPRMKVIVQELKEDELCAPAKIMVGGAAVTPTFAEGLPVTYAKDCAQGVRQAMALVA